MTQLQAIRKFADIVAGTHVTIARNRDDWGMGLSDLKHPRLILPADTNKNDISDRQFRFDFVSRCPLARGFANVTIFILHEIGHYYHPIEYFITDPEEYNNALDFDHFNLPCERVATDWAIQWLQDANNRKIAKAFERAYFGHTQGCVRAGGLNKIVIK
jgi:hypothetical protein